MTALGSSEAREVEARIKDLLEAWRRHDMGAVYQLHWNSSLFSKFNDTPPFERQDLQQAFMHEELQAASISDFQYQTRDLRVDVIRPEVAVATFYLDYRGMLVNNYTFEGRGIEATARVTMVFVRTPDGWRIAHEHFSRLPSS